MLLAVAVPMFFFQKLIFQYVLKFPEDAKVSEELRHFPIISVISNIFEIYLKFIIGIHIL